MKHILIAIVVTISLGWTIGGCYINFTPSGRAMWARYTHNLEKATEDNNYKNRKEVEDTARAMIASYTADLQTWNSYRNSELPDRKEWAELAKIRLNRTASTYNEYVRKNSYIWKDNVPYDIALSLKIME